MPLRPYQPGSVGVGGQADFRLPRNRQSVVPLTPLYTTLSIPALLLLDCHAHVTGTSGSLATAITEGVAGKTSTLGGTQPKAKDAGIRSFRTLLFDASMVVSYNPGITTTVGGCTVIAVTKRTNAATNWFFCEHGPNSGTTAGFYMYEEGTGSMGRYQTSAAFGTPTVKADWRGTAGTWYTRIARVTSGNVFTSRINGTNIPGTNSGTMGTPFSNTNIFHIGRRVGPALDFRGEVAMCAVYNGTLTDGDCEAAELVLRRRFKHY